MLDVAYLPWKSTPISVAIFFTRQCFPVLHECRLNQANKRILAFSPINYHQSITLALSPKIRDQLVQNSTKQCLNAVIDLVGKHGEDEIAQLTKSTCTQTIAQSMCEEDEKMEVRRGEIRPLGKICSTERRAICFCPPYVCAICYNATAFLYNKFRKGTTMRPD